VVQALKNCGEITGDLTQDRTCINEGMAEIANFEGITGNMTFDEQGDPIKCAVIVKIENQEFIAYKSACP
jgi:branched-chain amino acid transport system substrate-binding protein